MNMSEMFYEKNGVSVSDTVFNNGIEGQFPIRNISSLEIKYQMTSPLLMIIWGLLLSIIGGGIMYISEVGPVSVGLLIVGILLIVSAKKAALNASKVVLFIGGGGTPQTGMSLSMKDPSSKQELDIISNAINKSIANLQKT